MGKFLSQSGISLSRSYDLESSKDGADDLLLKEGVHLTHDMAAVMMMERMQANIFIMETAATAQNVAFSISANPLSQSVARIYGVTVHVDVTSRMLTCNICARDPTGTEIPLWVWDGTNEDTIRMDDGTALANQIVLRPNPAYNPLPMNMYGIDNPLAVNGFRLRGTTSGFGAGTVVALAQIYASFIDAEGSLGSRGVPIPSW